jgi:asparagine synthase (glutamine-hydrolysing)
LDKKLSDAEHDIIEVIEIIEDFNPMNVALALAQYWTFTEVRPKSIIALGQGTDELFGGYSRYLNIFREGGAKALKKEIMKKTLFSYFVNFEREWKLANHFDVYNLYPLISPRIVYYGASLPVSINIRSLDDGLRKHIVRELASRLGIDKEIALAPKRSLQYSSGTMDALRAISKRKGMKPHEYLYDVYRKYRNI